MLGVPVIPSDFRYWILTLFSTFSFAFSTKFLFKALLVTEVSLVSIIYKLNIVFVVILGIIFFERVILDCANIRFDINSFRQSFGDL